MSRLQRLPGWAFAAIAAVLSTGLLLFSTSGVGAGEETVEIHKMASARFDGFPDGPVFIAIVGTDDRPGVSGARADAIHVVGVNPEERQATVLNIPRDTWTELPGRGTSKINNSHPFGGAELVGQTLTQLTGAPVQYVITTNFKGFVGLVGDAGGVDIDLPIRVFDNFSGANFEAGERHMTGTQALALARSRKGVPLGDFTRTHHQGLLLLSGLRDFQEMEPTPADTMKLVALLLSHLKTTDGVTATDLYKLGRLALDIDPDQVLNITMPGTTGSAGGASVVFPTDAAQPLFDDFADDAIVQNPPAVDGAGNEFP